jgi:O-antigen/teichoic acid export membrane protein
MSPFRSILTLSAGDFFAKGLYFAAFIYMARVLGVDFYGVLEFSVSMRTYLLLAADGGLEMWAVRQVTKGEDVRRLVARVIPIRLLLAIATFLLLYGFLQTLSEQRFVLRTMLTLFGVTLFTQVISLKWVFMGQEKMARVVTGLLSGQIAFVGLVFGLVTNPERVLWIPMLWLAGELISAAYFWRLFLSEYGGLRIPFTLQGVRNVLRPAFALAAAHGLSLMNYNLDSILLGILKGPLEVGWYAAAYKPVTAAIAIPLSYFSGLFPALSRTWAAGQKHFEVMITRSLKLTTIFAMPLGIGGSFLAEPMIYALFGPDYSNSVPALQILCWSAVLITLRGNFRQSLNAVGRHRMDLLCACAAVALNLTLNLFLIPQFGILGAAAATLASELLWFGMAFYFFSRYVVQIKLTPILSRPVIAASAVAGFLVLTPSVFWVVRAALAAVLYFAVLILLGEPEIRMRLGMRSKAPLPASDHSTGPTQTSATFPEQPI